MATSEYFRQRRDSAFYVEQDPTTSSSTQNLVSRSASVEQLDNETHPTDIVSHDDKEKRSAFLIWCKLKAGPFKGILYTFLCSLFITLSSVIVKKMKYINPGQLSLVRNAGVLVGNIPIVAYIWQNPLGPREHRLLLFIRGFIGATSLYLNLLAYRLLPLAEAAIILSSLPALVMITARIFLKESCGIVQGFALLLTLSGVLLSMRLPELFLDRKATTTTFSVNYIAGIASAVGCLVLLAATFVALRKMKDVHFSILLIYLGFLGVVENASLTAAIGFYSLPYCGLDWMWMMLVGVFGFLGHCFLTLAIQKEAVGIVSVVKSSIDIVLAIVFQILFFSHIPDQYSIFGAMLVVFSVFIIGLRKWVLELPEDSTTRKKLAFLTF